MTSSNAFTVVPADSPADDVAMLRDLIARVEELQLAEDADGFVALFDEDAVWVTGGGRRLVGRSAIAQFTKSVLPGSFVDGSVRYRLAHIRFITPDVALTSIRQEYLTKDGGPLTPPQLGLPSYIWHRSQGRWRIAAGQNTGVPGG